jgi:baseplate J-like protein
VLELARLVGYALRPGLASTIYLAYTIDADRSVTPPKSIEALIPPGSRVQSVPGPGELPQSFETSDSLKARTEWNRLQPRMTRPQKLPIIRERYSVYLKGIATQLKPNDPLLIGLEGEAPEPYRVTEIAPDAAADRTLVVFRAWFTPTPKSAHLGEVVAGLADAQAFGVNAEKGIAKDVVERLRNLELVARSAPGDARLKEALARDVLPPLLKRLAEAKQRGFRKLEPWLGRIVQELRTVHADLERSTAAFFAEIAAPAANGADALPDSSEFLRDLQKAPSIPPASATRLNRSLPQTFAPGADIYPRMLTTLDRSLQKVLYSALRNLSLTRAPAIKVYALRVTASLFGHNSLGIPTKFDDRGTIIPTSNREWPVVENPQDATRSTGVFPFVHESKDVIDLDGSLDKITPGSWLLVETTETTLTKPTTMVLKALNANISLSRRDYGTSGKITRLNLGVLWITKEIGSKFVPSDSDFAAIRETAVFAQSEELALAEEPIEDSICDDQADPKPIELDGLYDGLEPGRWLIISGERSDIPNTSGVHASELVMLAAIQHPLPGAQQRMGDFASFHPARFSAGDKTHTFLTLSDKLAYCYKRESVVIYGNVVKATHGETRKEVLGNGDGSKPTLSFTLRQPPLTYLPAPTPAGAASTLSVRVNEVEWHEVDSLAGLLPSDRNFITQTDDEGKTKVIFGNGRQGARPPTGIENIKAVYRNGIGKAGNVKAEQASLLVTRPLGVKEVINPLPASGGADKESRDQARENAPIALLALDRLLSVKDYADFARTFAGIGKASAARLSDGRRQVVHVTIAGADDILIDEHSDLYRNLRRALQDFGDPHLAVEVKARELLLLIIEANVRVLPDYAWEFVAPRIRAALLETFSFARRALGQDVMPSEVIGAMQNVKGVAGVDLERLGGMSFADVRNRFAPSTAEAARTKPVGSAVERVSASLARVNPNPEPNEPTILPAQLAILSPDVPDTLILHEVR